MAVGAGSWNFPSVRGGGDVAERFGGGSGSEPRVPGQQAVERVGWVAALAALAAFLVLWELTARLMNTPVLPGPMAVWRLAVTGGEPAFLSHLWASTRRVLLSLVIALLAGVPLGLFVGRRRDVDRVVGPLVYLTYPVPKIVLLPVILTLLGLGDSSRVFLITLTVFYQVLVTTRDAVRTLDPAAILSLRSLGGGEWDLYRHVLFPASLPKIFTALRISVGTAIAVLFFAESFATTSGLGYLIMDAWGRANYEAMFLGIAAMSLLGLALYLLIEASERRWCRWSPGGGS